MSVPKNFCITSTSNWKSRYTSTEQKMIHGNGQSVLPMLGLYRPQGVLFVAHIKKQYA